MTKKIADTERAKTKSISRRFSYALIIIVTCMLAGFATVSIFLNISRMNTKLNDKLENTLKLAETSLITPLWNFDATSINDFIDALFHDKSIVYFRIFESDDTIASRLQPEFQDYDFETFEISSQFLAKTSYIVYQDKEIGTIQIAISRKSVQEESLNQMFTIIALTIFVIVAISLTSMFIARRYISVPLSKLQESTTLIANGDLDASIDSSSRDEIGKLAYNLNVMRKSIKQLFGALRESNEKFEESNRILKDSEERIRAIVETAADGIITIDENDVVETFNPAAERMFSYDAVDVIGKDVSMLMTTPDFKANIGDQMRYWHTNEESMDDGVHEVLGKQKDGTCFSMDLAVSEVHLGDKRLFTGIVHDITERKRTEQILSNYNRTLEDEVMQRTKELSTAIENLKATQSQLVEAEKMASLGGLVAGVAHEINTPIGIGVTLASLFSNETDALRNAYKENRMKRSELEAYIETMSQSSSMLTTNLNRAAELIQSFKQVAVDQTTEEQRKFTVKAYLEEVLLSLQPKLKQKRHSIVIEGDEDLSLNSYPGVFSQIVTNLLMNSLAHAYNPDDKVNLSFRFSHKSDKFMFQYSDDGRGISEENLKKIFDPFYTTNRNKGGSGLGLHIIYNLVTQKLGGTIHCESTVGVGTKFIITLPA